MEITRQFIRTFVIIVGLLVLLSYVYGVSKSDDATALWGGIPLSWTKFIIPWMFIAAIGFLMYWWTILYSVDVSVIENLRWPWGESDGKGANRLLLTYCVFMIPSMLWLESTQFHMNNEYSWTPFLVIGILTLASIGNIMFGLLAYSAYEDGVEGASTMLLGSVMLSIQCIFLDGILWNVKFPW
tara:strand:+ start:72 stop:623 length:552 start_codon:yes stop_codon:yes gene_type:complete